MKFCGKCGNQLAPVQKFCNKCGAPNPDYAVAASVPGVDKKEDIEKAERLKQQQEAQEQKRFEAERQRQAEIDAARAKAEQEKAETERRAKEAEERQKAEATEREQKRLDEEHAAQQRLAEAERIEHERQQAEAASLQQIEETRKKLLDEISVLTAIKQQYQTGTPGTARIPLQRGRRNTWMAVIAFVVLALLAGGAYYYYEYYSREKKPAAEAPPPATVAAVDTGKHVDTAVTAMGPTPAASTNTVKEARETKEEKVAKAPSPVTATPPAKPKNRELTDAQIIKDLVGKKLSADITIHTAAQVASIERHTTTRISDTEINYELYMTVSDDSGQLYICHAGVSYKLSDGQWQMSGNPVQHFLDLK